MPQSQEQAHAPRADYGTGAPSTTDLAFWNPAVTAEMLAFGVYCLNPSAKPEAPPGALPVNPISAGEGARALAQLRNTRADPWNPIRA